MSSGISTAARNGDKEDEQYAVKPYKGPLPSCVLYGCLSEEDHQAAQEVAKERRAVALQYDGVIEAIREAICYLSRAFQNIYAVYCRPGSQFLGRGGYLRMPYQQQYEHARNGILPYIRLLHQALYEMHTYIGRGQWSYEPHHRLRDIDRWICPRDDFANGHPLSRGASINELCGGLWCGTAPELGSTTLDVAYTRLTRATQYVYGIRTHVPLHDDKVYAYFRDQFHGGYGSLIGQLENVMGIIYKFDGVMDLKPSDKFDLQHNPPPMTDEEKKLIGA